MVFDVRGGHLLISGNRMKKQNTKNIENLGKICHWSGLWSSDQEKVFTFFRTDRNRTGRNRTGPGPDPDRSDIRGAKASHHGSWIMDHGSWIMDQGSRIKDQRSSIKYQGSWIKYQVSSIKYQVSSIKDQGSWTLDLVLAWMTILEGIPTWDQDHPNLLSKIYHFI